jgi:hypothetical protein
MVPYGSFLLFRPNFLPHNIAFRFDVVVASKLLPATR